MAIEYISEGAIAHDLLNLIRSSQVTQSEPISLRQIYSWINQYRSILIKQDWDKKKYISTDWQQQIQSLELEEVDSAEGSNISTDRKMFRTILQLPSTITTNFSSGYTYIGTITGEEIMLVPESRSLWQKYKKYTGSDRIAFLREGRIYVENDKELRYITVRAVWEVPSEVSQLNNPNESIEDVTANSPYPISIAMLPTLKRMILEQELGIFVSATSDLSNDSASKTESNIIGK